MLIVSINSPSGEGGEQNNCQSDFQDFVNQNVSINSPSGEGGETIGDKFNEELLLFPLILLQAKAVSIFKDFQFTISFQGKSFH